MRASGSVELLAPGLGPVRELASTRAPVENSSKPVGSIEWYCQWRSPQMR